MRRISVGIALVCLTVGTLCFGVFFVQAAWFVMHMTSVDEGLAQIRSVQNWGWCFIGLYGAAFAVLFLARHLRQDWQKIDHLLAAYGLFILVGIGIIIVIVAAKRFYFNRRSSNS